MNENTPKRISTLSHWGAYQLEVGDGRIRAAHPSPDDADPSPIGRSIPGAVHHRSRVSQPMARKSWLERGPENHGGGRGAEPFVPISWDRAMDLVADELDRVKRQYGNDAIFGGSYGWASAGRFHHCQSQLHRFLNCHGGYVRSVDSYSSAAARVILPHVVGRSSLDFQRWGASWEIVAEACELIVMFGGAPLRNAQIEQGGPTRHVLREALTACRDNGVEFVNISPLRDDLADFLAAQWLAPRPNSDTTAVTPIIDQDTIFIAGGYGDGCALVQFDNGSLYTVYKNREMSNHMNTCVLWEGHLYGFHGNGSRPPARTAKLGCMEHETGDVRWEERGLGCGSLMMADGKLIVLSDTGELVIVEATPTEQKIVSRAKVLGGKCWTVPVLAHGRIYCRNAAGDLVCVDVRR